MKTTTCVMMFGCLFLLVGGKCLAVDSVSSKPVAAKGEQFAELGSIRHNDQLRVWVDSVKPAAGHVEPVSQESGYWEKAVRRGNQRHLQE